MNPMNGGLGTLKNGNPSGDLTKLPGAAPRRADRPRVCVRPCGIAGGVAARRPQHRPANAGGLERSRGAVDPRLSVSGDTRAAREQSAPLARAVGATYLGQPPGERNHTYGPIVMSATPSVVPSLTRVWPHPIVLPKKAVRLTSVVGNPHKA